MSSALQTEVQVLSCSVRACESGLSLLSLIVLHCPCWIPMPPSDGDDPQECPHSSVSVPFPLGNGLGLDIHFYMFKSYPLSGSLFLYLSNWEEEVDWIHADVSSNALWVCDISPTRVRTYESIVPHTRVLNLPFQADFPLWVGDPGWVGDPVWGIISSPRVILCTPQVATLRGVLPLSQMLPTSWLTWPVSSSASSPCGCPPSLPPSGSPLDGTGQVQFTDGALMVECPQWETTGYSACLKAEVKILECA